MENKSGAFQKLKCYHFDIINIKIIQEDTRPSRNHHDRAVTHQATILSTLPDLNALIHQLWTLSTLDTHPDQFIPEIPIYTSVVPGIEVVIKEVTYWFSASLKYKNMTKTANYFEVL